MIALLLIDWEKVFIPSGSVLEIILRGTVIYLFLFIIFRVLRRGAGAIGISDLLVVVLIADAAQNAMSAEYKSITEGAILVATIVGWDFLLDWLVFRFPGLTFLHPPALLLVKDGRMLQRNLRKEMISEEELLGELREQGVEDVKEVKYSYMEANGHISVVKKSKGGKESGGKKKQGGGPGQ
ncbi:MAG TPA: YetF domain-containing protein [Pyrinomonadaceae bacterium]|nr:YetF domain-containing protein [Pyrinomonadaceae bacterium]